MFMLEGKSTFAEGPADQSASTANLPAPIPAPDLASYLDMLGRGHHVQLELRFIF